MQQNNWFSFEVKEVIQELNSDIVEGLSAEEANKRLETYGANVLQEAPPRSLFLMFIDQIKEPLVLILLIAAVISGIVGEMGDTVLIMIIVILNAALGVFQENKAEQALKALKAMTKVYVKVIRDGKTTQVPAEELVPGDLVLLEAGDAVPADARILEAASLRVNEAAMTGESVPVEKTTEVITAEDVPIGDRKNMLFAGTAVTGGRAKAVVTGTGMSTELGKIAQMLQDGTKEQTPLQRQLAKLGKNLGLIALGIVLIVFITGIIRGEEIFQMFMTAIALAVAAIPEGLPAVVTIVLALGVTRMSQRKAVIRKLPAVETLGVATYICSDKTGTLTKNEMTAIGLYVYDRILQVTGGGYVPKGEFYSAEGRLEPLNDQVLRTLLLGGVLNTEAYLKQNEKGYYIIGDPTEGALVVVGAKTGLHKEDMEKQYPRLAEIPFDSARKMMTTFHQIEGELLSITKGAPDILVARCTHLLTSDGVKELDDQICSRLLEVNKSLASQGQRLLALAIRKWPELPGILEAENVEKELTFVGYFALQDPPRDEVKDAVAICRRAGIKAVMITGDHQDTAVAIARKLDIWREGDGILTGSELEKMSQEELEKVVLNTTVYARVSPEHKLRIVDALKANQQIVAMTGDGVNDAPALKRADIGAAMGITGTEVSKEAADMVLLDDNFATIVNAVEEGRTIYDNIRKSVQYLLSCNLGEIVTIFMAILLGMGSPLLPVQILWLNLVTDSAPALALGVDPTEKGIMQRKPRDAHAGIFAYGVGVEIFLQGIIIGLVSFAAYWLAFLEGRPLVEAHTMAFVTLAFSQLVHSFNMRSRTESVFSFGKNPNYKLAGAFLICAFLQLVVIFVPFLRELFNTAILQPTDWAFAFALSLVPLFVVEVVKIFKRHRKSVS